MHIHRSTLNRLACFEYNESSINILLTFSGFLSSSIYNYKTKITGFCLIDNKMHIKSTTNAERQTHTHTQTLKCMSTFNWLVITTGFVLLFYNSCFCCQPCFSFIWTQTAIMLRSRTTSCCLRNNWEDTIKTAKKKEQLRHNAIHVRITTMTLSE